MKVKLAYTIVSQRTLKRWVTDLIEIEQEIRTGVVCENLTEVGGKPRTPRSWRGTICNYSVQSGTNFFHIFTVNVTRISAADRSKLEREHVHVPQGKSRASTEG